MSAVPGGCPGRSAAACPGACWSCCCVGTYTDLVTAFFAMEA